MPTFPSRPAFILRSKYLFSIGLVLGSWTGSISRADEMYLVKIFVITQSGANHLGSLLDLCNKYCGCLIRMTLLSSPSRSYLSERSQLT
ncbi:hypothetical protein BDR06DRAFT_964437 [Suillus hirtellus]|nr:hypothetical protein BDR06DRAFT_964437 [Suillus hirtellus]